MLAYLARRIREQEERVAIISSITHAKRIIVENKLRNEELTISDPEIGFTDDGVLLVIHISGEEEAFNHFVFGIPRVTYVQGEYAEVEDLFSKTMIFL